MFGRRAKGLLEAERVAGPASRRALAAERELPDSPRPAVLIRLVLYERDPLFGRETAELGAPFLIFRRNGDIGIVPEKRDIVFGGEAFDDGTRARRAAGVKKDLFHGSLLEIFLYGLDQLTDAGRAGLLVEPEQKLFVDIRLVRTCELMGDDIAGDLVFH